MCLDSLADFEVPDPGVGWKVFNGGIEYKSIPHVQGWYFAFEPYSVFYKWVHEVDFRGNDSEEWGFLDTDDNIKYPAGFHLYLTKEDAEDSMCFEDDFILPVCYQNVVATGYQDYKKVVVAKEMMILTEEP